MCGSVSFQKIFSTYEHTHTYTHAAQNPKVQTLTSVINTKKEMDMCRELNHKLFTKKSPIYISSPWQPLALNIY